MQKFIVGLLIVVVFCGLTIPKRKKAIWQSWATIHALQQQTAKPILVDIYTDWCKYCKVMDATTYRKDSVVNYLKQHFYRYKLNAEKNDSINWQQKVYRFNPRYNTHDFAVYLTKGNTVYPTTAIINTKGQPYFQPGALDVNEMEFLLKYMIEAEPKGITMDAYKKTFVSKWK
jgi:thioredoxin-related protein